MKEHRGGWGDGTIYVANRKQKASRMVTKKVETFLFEKREKDCIVVGRVVRYWAQLTIRSDTQQTERHKKEERIN